MTEENADSKNKTLSQQREHHRIWSKGWRARNKEHIRLYNLEYRKQNAYILYRKRYNIRHWQENKEQISSKNKQYYVGAKCYINFERRITFSKSREALFHILGHACVKCGQFDKRILQFDHINGGGTKEHKTDFLNARLNFYQFYAHNPLLAKEKLQILCANCNILKKYETKKF